MIKRKVLSFVCTILIASIALIACSSKQSTSSQNDISGQSKQSAEEVKPVGFIGLANENKERIWYRVDDSNDDGQISKDDKIEEIYTVKNGKITSYFVWNGADNTVLLKDVSEKSENEVQKLAKKQDKYYFEKKKESIVQSLSDPSFDEQVRNKAKNLNYDNFTKYYSNKKLQASVETDSSGNYVVLESINFWKNPIDKMIDDFEVYIEENPDPQEIEISRELSNVIYGQIYKQNYAGYLLADENDFLVTSALAKSTTLEFDKLNTKNVTEE